MCACIDDNTKTALSRSYSGIELSQQNDINAYRSTKYNIPASQSNNNTNMTNPSYQSFITTVTHSRMAFAFT